MPARQRTSRKSPPASEAPRTPTATPDHNPAPDHTEPKIQASDLRDLQNLRGVAKLLERLHQVGTQRDKSGNRDLRMDQYCLLVLMWLYNPIVDSLRGLQQASTLKEVQQRLGVGRASLGSLSESVRVFDPEPLAEIAHELQQQIPLCQPGEFGMIHKTITAVDGSVFRVLQQIASLAWLPKGPQGKAQGKHFCGYRLHTQFEVFRGVPSRIDLTPAKPKGADSERAVLEHTITAERCYLFDRGYEKYTLWNAIHAKGSNYVGRVRDKLTCKIAHTNPLTPAARDADVIADHVIRLGVSEQSKHAPDHATRLIVIKIAPHSSRAHKAECGPDSDGYLRLVTDLLDIPAEIIAAMYLLRWTIEMFFRVIKQLLGCRHLLSTKPEGVEIQIYMAIIACVMILALTGKQPTKRTFELLCFYLQGWASLDELESHIQKLAFAKA